MMKHSILGLYMHDQYVYTNNDNCSSPYWMENHEKKSLTTYLQASEYRTAYYGEFRYRQAVGHLKLFVLLGKYLNNYTGHHIPPGWDDWQGLFQEQQVLQLHHQQ